MQIRNRSVDNCKIIDYIFQGAMVKMYQYNTLQATWALFAHIQNNRTQAHSDFEYNKALMLTYLASKQDYLSYNTSSYGF